MKPTRSGEVFAKFTKDDRQLSVALNFDTIPFEPIHRTIKFCSHSGFVVKNQSFEVQTLSQAIEHWAKSNTLHLASKI